MRRVESPVHRGALRTASAPPWPYGVAGHASLAAPSNSLPGAPEPATLSIPAHTFQQCAREYIDAQAPGWKSRKHAAQWSSTLERYAFPVIARLDVARISNAQILDVLRPIWQTKTETVTRVRGRMESIFDWAIYKGFRNGSNPARWEQNLEHELPSPTKLKKRKERHHPALPHLAGASIRSKPIALIRRAQARIAA